MERGFGTQRGTRPETTAEGPALVVRRAAPADHDDVLRLLRDLELDYPARDLARFVVAERGGAIVGVAELRPFDGFRLLSCVGIREDLQGLGLGRELVERALDGVRDEVYLYTLVPGFFAKLGFVEALRTPPRLPPRMIYGCANCTPESCRAMVRLERAAAGPDFRPMREEDEARVGAALARVESPTCDLSLASLAIWRDCEAPSVAEVDGNVCIVLDPHHEPRYALEPVGDGDVVAAFEACVRAAGRASRVRASFAARLDPARFDLTPLPDHADYVYETKSLADLRGPQHDGTRNRVRKFAREHPRAAFRPLAAADAAAALALFDAWSRDRDDGRAAPPASVATACQRRAIERAFEGFARLGLRGGALVEDGAMLGFLVASTAGGTANVHFLHAGPALQGAAQTLVRECCRIVFPECALVDLEEDLGAPGLRRTKLAYRPVRTEAKFEVRIRSGA